MTKTMHLMSLARSGLSVCGVRGREGVSLTMHSRLVTCDDCKARYPSLFQEPTPKQQAQTALGLLKHARKLIKAADNRRTLARIDAAISSARGAVRIQDYRETRARVRS